MVAVAEVEHTTGALFERLAQVEDLLRVVREPAKDVPLEGERTVGVFDRVGRGERLEVERGGDEPVGDRANGVALLGKAEPRHLAELVELADVVQVRGIPIEGEVHADVAVCELRRWRALLEKGLPCALAIEAVVDVVNSDPGE